MLNNLVSKDPQTPPASIPQLPGDDSGTSDEEDEISFRVLNAIGQSVISNDVQGLRREMSKLTKLQCQTAANGNCTYDGETAALLHIAACEV